MNSLALFSFLQAAPASPKEDVPPAQEALQEAAPLEVPATVASPLATPASETAEVVQEEATLLQRIGLGDEAAFTALYQRWAAAFSAMSLKICADVRDAEECVQEGFLHLWRKAQTYNAERSSPFTWAYMIFRNKALDRLRARERQVRGTERVQVELTAAEPAAESPAEVQVRKEEHAVVKQALGDITQEQRVAIEMAFFAGLTHLEIAERLGEPLGTIKARIRRGLAQLGEMISRRFE